ncbi:MAG: hypothetical protein F4041_19485 [Acidobacteriia bacterium]|nr:hypothetical protein [Terriglobia bacterium]
MLEIERAFRQPVQFRGQEYIRVSSYKKKLKDFPQSARALRHVFDQTPVENGIAAERVPDDALLRLLDYPAYLDLLRNRLPGNRNEILDALNSDAWIERSDAGGWNVTSSLPYVEDHGSGCLNGGEG